ncbi:succinyl-diaminopimelate desuccinylase, partial [Alteromonas sp. MCA-1]|nr:succinyl-diaminopimelate desuccinylase [Alteromonas sp. MCA-1]
MSIQPLPSIAPARSIHFAEVLMARASITPQDAGCQSYLMYKLEKLGFSCEKHTINGVSNLIARWGQGPNPVSYT